MGEKTADQTEQIDTDILVKAPNRLVILLIGFISIFMVWVEVDAVIASQEVTGWETDLGKIYLIAIALIVLAEYKAKPQLIKKVWVWGGLGLIIFSLITYSVVQDIAQDIEAEAAADGLGGVTVDLQLGIFLIFISSLGIFYVGYQMSSETLLPAIENRRSERVGSVSEQMDQFDNYQSDVGSENMVNTDNDESIGEDN